jgi:hypothetical protein
MVWDESRRHDQAGRQHPGRDQQLSSGYFVPPKTDECIAGHSRRNNQEHHDRKRDRVRDSHVARTKMPLSRQVNRHPAKQQKPDIVVGKESEENARNPAVAQRIERLSH